MELRRSRRFNCSRQLQNLDGALLNTISIFEKRGGTCSYRLHTAGDGIQWLSNRVRLGIGRYIQCDAGKNFKVKLVSSNVALILSTNNRLKRKLNNLTTQKRYFNHFPIALFFG